MSCPEEHSVLGFIFELLRESKDRDQEEHQDFRLESECIEFRDLAFEEEEGEPVWYEIVVRRIDEPSDEGSRLGIRRK
jgi:hypothetical protein